MDRLLLQFLLRREYNNLAIACCNADLSVAVQLRHLLGLLNLLHLIIQTSKLPFGKGDAGLLVDGRHKRGQHLVHI